MGRFRAIGFGLLILTRGMGAIFKNKLHHKHALETAKQLGNASDQQMQQHRFQSLLGQRLSQEKKLSQQLDYELRTSHELRNLQQLDPGSVSSNKSENFDIGPDFGEYVRSMWGDAVSASVVETVRGPEVTAQCPKGPRVWMLLYGEYRTFKWVAPSIAGALRAAGGSCYHVVMAIENYFVRADGDRSCGCGHSELEWVTDRGNNTAGLVEQLREDSQQFDGQLSFALLHKTDMQPSHYGLEHIGSFYFITGFFAWAPWVLARFVASKNNLKIDPLSIVIHSRPDILFNIRYDTRPLLDYIQKTDGATDKFFTQKHDPDLIGISSFVAFERNICLQVDRGMRRIMAGDPDAGEVLFSFGVANRLGKVPSSILQSVFGATNTPAAQTHWQEFGQIEGRDCSCQAQAAAPPQSRPFDIACNWQCYLDRYSDLQSKFGATNTAAAKTHWQEFGQSEGRDCSCQSPSAGPPQSRPHEGEQMQAILTLDHHCICRPNKDHLCIVNSHRVCDLSEVEKTIYVGEGLLTLQGQRRET